MAKPKKLTNDWQPASDKDIEFLFEDLNAQVQTMDHNTRLELAQIKWNTTVTGVMSVIMMLNHPIQDKMSMVYNLALYMARNYPAETSSIILTDEDEFPKDIDLEKEG